METITDLIKGVICTTHGGKFESFLTIQQYSGEYDCGYGKCRIVPRSPGWSGETWNAPIAITCGSRGMSNNAVMAKAIVDLSSQKVQNRNIVPAMGSPWWCNC